MSFELYQIKEAYNKLKSYIYYDSTDILLRRKLVEFETNTTKDILSIIQWDAQPYNKNLDIFSCDITQTFDITQSVEKKLEVFTEKLNKYHKDSEFFDHFIDLIDATFYPKDFKESESEKNFISNRRVEDNYPINRVTAFIDAPIELHLIATLWVLEHGKNLDKELGLYCFGNRLLMTKENDKVVQGSSLFKPYYKQYQKWRDDSVRIAQNILKEGKNVLFLNLDIRDYFHSVRIGTNRLFDGKREYNILQPYYNLKEIFLKIHTTYTKKISLHYQVPYEFFDNLKKDEVGNLKEVILPIGLVSSYVLANDYLRPFDNRMIQKIKPTFYGRYVDDILIVIADPKLNYHQEEEIEELKFIFNDYKTTLNNKASENNSDEKVSFKEEDLSQLEKYILANFHPVLKLVDSPDYIKSSCDKKNDEIEKVFKLCGYESLFCQSNKSLAYFFDNEESDLVIDKLKKELDKKTSEFRDFPEDDDNNSFEESAYHLQYDGTDGKIRTLKDYKENRYGLTVYLANKIFSALRHESEISDEEIKQVLKFFRGINCLEFYRLWERIFTYFLVNRQAKAYVTFYLHCIEQIQNISGEVYNTKVDVTNIQNTLTDYLDCAHELTLSLNPGFIKETQDAARHFEFQLNKFRNSIAYFFKHDFSPTKPDSFWVRRFRETNMIRHHYVIHPLLNYTTDSKKGIIDLTTLKLSIDKYSLDIELLNNSPRPVKFWECCMATVFTKLSAFEGMGIKQSGGHCITDILGVQHLKEDASNGKVLETQFYLDEAFELFKQVNNNHIPSYKLHDEELKEQFFKRKYNKVQYDEIYPLGVQEIEVKSKDKLHNPKIAFANTEVKESNIILSIRKNPNLALSRYKDIAGIFKTVRGEKADILLFPEFFIPINLLSSIVRYSEKNMLLTVTGLEHLNINNTAFNFIVTILPIEVNGVKDAIVVFRLKNHYAHIEELLIDGNHTNVPRPSQYRYDIFIWKNIYFSTYYCFELANALHRSLMKGKIDLLIGVEWNKDTPYFSNIVEAGSRDLHTYVAQVNTSQYGDTRLTQPVESAKRDILRLKGGSNNSILVASIDIFKLREFQRKKFALTHHEKEFKPLPPDFKLDDVLKRTRNQSVL